MDIMNTPYPKPAMQLDNSPYPFALPGDQPLASAQAIDQPPTRGDSIGVSNDPVQMPNSCYGTPTMTTGAMAGMSTVPAFDAEPGASKPIMGKRSM